MTVETFLLSFHKPRNELLTTEKKSRREKGRQPAREEKGTQKASRVRPGKPGSPASDLCSQRNPRESISFTLFFPKIYYPELLP